MHSDHLGSSNVITDESGDKVSQTEYQPFGSISKQTGEDVTHYKFTGKEFDDATGLYYYGARYYDPAIGRFIQADSIVQAPFDPQTLNRYSYCRNNPLKYVDPTGHFAWFIPFIVAAIKGAVIGAAIGVGMAAVMGGDIGKGALFGAIGGAVFAGFSSLAQSAMRFMTVPGGIGPMTQGATMSANVLGAVGGGAAAGVATAAASGSDIGKGALSGGLFGAASLAGIPNFHPFGQGRAASIGNRLFNSGITGSALGALQQGVTGGDILEGAKRGGLAWMAGEGFNMAVGHTFGFAKSGFKKPDFKDGFFYYNSEKMGNFITFGNVVTGPSKFLDEPFVNINGFEHPTGTYRDHEMYHGQSQGMALGPSYIPAHIASGVIGTIYGLPTFRVDGYVRYNFLETAWQDYPVN